MFYFILKFLILAAVCAPEYNGTREFYLGLFYFILFYLSILFFVLFHIFFGCGCSRVHSSMYVFAYITTRLQGVTLLVNFDTRPDKEQNVWGDLLALAAAAFMGTHDYFVFHFFFLFFFHSSSLLAFEVRVVMCMLVFSEVFAGGFVCSSVRVC